MVFVARSEFRVTYRFCLFICFCFSFFFSFVCITLYGVALHRFHHHRFCFSPYLSKCKITTLKKCFTNKTIPKQINLSYNIFIDYGMSAKFWIVSKTMQLQRVITRGCGATNFLQGKIVWYFSCHIGSSFYSKKIFNTILSKFQAIELRISFRI